MEKMSAEMVNLTLALSLPSSPVIYIDSNSAEFSKAWLSFNENIAFGPLESISAKKKWQTFLDQGSSPELHCQFHILKQETGSNVYLSWLDCHFPLHFSSKQCESHT